MEKIKVYTCNMVGGSTLYSESLDVLLETLKYELENYLEEDSMKPVFNFGVIYMTREEINAAGEFDGF